MVGLAFVGGLQMYKRYPLSTLLLFPLPLLSVYDSHGGTQTFFPLTDLPELLFLWYLSLLVRGYQAWLHPLAEAEVLLFPLPAHDSTYLELTPRQVPVIPQMGGGKVPQGITRKKREKDTATSD